MTRAAALAGLALLAASLGAATAQAEAQAAGPDSPIRFAGPLVSSAGSLPAKLAVFADCDDHRPRILGKADGGHYQIDLPARTSCTIVVGEYDWEAHVLPVSDAATAVPPTILVFPRQVPEPALAEELLAMGRGDQAPRDHWRADDAAFVAQAAAQDAVRQKRLLEITAAKGWPTFSMVGADAADAAWLVAQHAPLALLKPWLAMMREANTRHEIFPLNLATSIDRVLVRENKEQLYGTQFRGAPDGTMRTYPIADPAHLDERRLAVGLPTWAAYLAQTGVREAKAAAASP